MRQKLPEYFTIQIEKGRATAKKQKLRTFVNIEC